jgi:hypothetical protein
MSALRKREPMRRSEEPDRPAQNDRIDVTGFTPLALKSLALWSHPF